MKVYEEFESITLNKIPYERKIIYYLDDNQNKSIIGTIEYPKEIQEQTEINYTEQEVQILTNLLNFQSQQEQQNLAIMEGQAILYEMLLKQQ